MFYCHSGYNRKTKKHEIIWVCDTNKHISVSISRPLQIENILIEKINGHDIATLAEVQEFIDSLDYDWHEPNWDVYNDDLKYLRSIPRLT